MLSFLKKGRYHFTMSLRITNPMFAAEWRAEALGWKKGWGPTAGTQLVQQGRLRSANAHKGWWASILLPHSFPKIPFLPHCHDKASHTSWVCRDQILFGEIIYLWAKHSSRCRSREKEANSITFISSCLLITEMPPFDNIWEELGSTMQRNAEQEARSRKMLSQWIFWA